MNKSRIGSITIDKTAAMFHLVTSAYEKDDLPRALTLFEEAFLGKQRLVHRDNHLLITCRLYSVGNFLQENGQTATALDCFEAALNIFQENAGADGLEFTNTAFVMGLVCCDL